VVLMQITSCYDVETTSGNHSNPSIANTAKRPRIDRKLLWTCPSQYIDQLCSDSHGDLIIAINAPVHITGPWHQNQPTILDRDYANYVVLQSLLEQTIGIKLARMHPLYPSIGLLQGNIRKRYLTGLRSYLFSPTMHIYRLFGCVLYEYSYRPVKAAANGKGSNESGEEDSASNEAATAPSNAMKPWKIMQIGPHQLIAASTEEHSELLLTQFFPPPLIRSSPYSALLTNPVPVCVCSCSLIDSCHAFFFSCHYKQHADEQQCYFYSPAEKTFVS